MALLATRRELTSEQRRGSCPRGATRNMRAEELALYMSSGVCSPHHTPSSFFVFSKLRTCSVFLDITSLFVGTLGGHRSIENTGALPKVSAHIKRLLLRVHEFCICCQVLLPMAIVACSRLLKHWGARGKHVLSNTLRPNAPLALDPLVHPPALDQGRHNGSTDECSPRG